jgi:hypothetical protein
VPRTVTHPALFDRGGDEAFRETLYLMRLAACMIAARRSGGPWG